MSCNNTVVQLTMFCRCLLHIYLATFPAYLFHTISVRDGESDSHEKNERTNWPFVFFVKKRNSFGYISLHMFWFQSTEAKIRRSHENLYSRWILKCVERKNMKARQYFWLWRPTHIKRDRVDLYLHWFGLREGINKY